MTILSGATVIPLDPAKIQSTTFTADLLMDIESNTTALMATFQALEDAAYEACLPAGWVDPRDPFLLAEEDPAYAAHVAAEQASCIWYQLDTFRARIEREVAA